MQDLKTRTLSALIFAAVVIGCIFLNTTSITILFAIITMICFWEFIQLMLPAYQPKILLIGAMCLALSIFLQPSLYLQAVSQKVWYFNLVFLFLILILDMLYSKNSDPTKAMKLIMGLVCIVYPLSIVHEFFIVDGVFLPWKIMSFLLLIWTSDIGQYFSGRLFGKNLLAPKISPKKTIEGFIGGLILTLVMGFVFSYIFDFYTLQNWLIIAAIISIFGSLGDLYESYLKRSAGVKDSGNIMPGHGGMYDRFDAFIFSLPFLYVYTNLFI